MFSRIMIDFNGIMLFCRVRRKWQSLPVKVVLDCALRSTPIERCIGHERRCSPIPFNSIFKRSATKILQVHVAVWTWPLSIKDE
jgi:hypothetical protein